jgi:hypothetical protein
MAAIFELAWMSAGEDDRRGRAVSGWHLWLGSEVTRPRCEVCSRRRFVFRYTNGDLDVWVCPRHRSVIPGRDEQ